MVSLIYSLGTGFCIYAGLSTDTKPTEGVNTGSEFREIDTGKKYYFSSATNEWLLPSGGGGSDTSAKVGTGKVGSMIIE